MTVRRLTEGEYRATFTARMLDVTADPGVPVDLWPYVEAIPARDLEGHVLGTRAIEKIYRASPGRYDHVLVQTNTQDAVLVVVVDHRDHVIYGHRMLDLRVGRA